MNIKPNTQADRRQRLLLKVPLALLLPALLFSIVFVSLAVDSTDFERENNLSKTGRLENLQSSPPKMVTNGSTVVVVWSDRYTDVQPADIEYAKDFGNIYLKSANENDGYWRPKVKVFTADADHWATNPDVIFDQDNPNTVHVVWAQGDTCSQGSGENCPLTNIRYNRCDVSGNINRCQTPVTVAGNDTTNRFNPKIALDDDQGLHIVWSENGNKVSYSHSENGGAGWSSPAEVTAVTDAGGGRDIQFIATGGRLHLVWNDELNDRIKYLYDADDEDNTLALNPGDPNNIVRSFKAQSGPPEFINGNPDNPIIAGQGSWVFIAFDVQHQVNDTDFALFYTMSTDNGSTWATEFNIPRQNDPFLVQTFETEDVEALKPSLAITTTGAMTYLHVAWQEKIDVGSLFSTFAQRIRFSNLPLARRVDVQPVPEWTNILTATEKLDSEEKHAAPSLAVTDPPPAGLGKGHVVYLTSAERKDDPTKIQADIFYKGSIVGTIDPDYILDAFVSARGGSSNPLDIKLVTPNVIQADSLPIAEKLDYLISFTNTGNLDAIGIGITDTFPTQAEGLTYNNDLQVTGGGTFGYQDKGDHQEITWFGNVPAGQGVHIKFSVTTNNQLVDLAAINFTVRNRVTMWNLGTAGEPIKPRTPPIPKGTIERCDPNYTDCADTRIAVTIIYLPIIRK